MRYSLLFVILMLALGAAQFSSLGSFGFSSSTTVPPAIVGSKTVTLCSLVTYRFSPAPSGATFGLKSTNIQAGTTKYFYDLPSQVNFFWGPSQSDIGVYSMQAFVDHNGVKSAYGAPLTVKVGSRLAGTGNDCPYEKFSIVSSFTRSAFSTTSAPSVSIPTYGFSAGQDESEAGTSTTSSAPMSPVRRFGFKDDGADSSLYMNAGVIAIVFGFLLVAFYYFGIKD